MHLLFLLLVSIYQAQTLILGELHGPSADYHKLNEIDKSVRDDRAINAAKTSLEIKYPLKSIAIDYENNALVLQLPKSFREPNTKALQDDFMRFGKRELEQLPSMSGDDSRDDFRGAGGAMRFGRSIVGSRDSRGDNFMRFGRAPAQDYMRFRRAAGQDFMRFGRTPSAQDYMRFGRAPSAKDYMRFGRAPGQDYMRFGRAPSAQDYMRFGRSQPAEKLRAGRDPKEDFMRFGRTDKSARSSDSNFMRFGRSGDENPIGSKLADNNSSSPLADVDGNPVDAAMNVFYGKQREAKSTENAENPEY